MKTKDVVALLQSYLPPVTDLFSSVLSVTSLSLSTLTVTAVTASAHSRATGDWVTITGAKTPVTISTLTQTSGVAKAVCATKHDLTEEWNETVEIVGAVEAQYNGVHALISVESETVFYFAVDAGAPATATGAPLLLEVFGDGYNGRHQITVVDPVTFTYTLTSGYTGLGTPAQGTIKAHLQQRIVGAGSVSDIEAYTQRTANASISTPTAFVVLGDMNVSRDRYQPTDANNRQGPGDNRHMACVQNVSIYVAQPRQESESGMPQRDQLEDIRAYLYKALVGQRVVSNFQESGIFKINPLGDAMDAVLGSHYIFRYDFQAVFDIVYADTVGADLNRAFRSGSFTLQPYTQLLTVDGVKIT